ncbi:patatin-like phospholipase family protein [Corallococcus sp. AB004]|uniref:patatin-like phospholipase family protein n=1 Tax=Corallococcus exiguus TaxID=83462 RepID=UPI000EA37670|nr:patatin-like phospholipase family protein [Corallococcus exiguus]NPD27908.1 patatin-like phospholipase family protein [Corallococcus exiguus]NRD48269.1 patatin-like phospholipase family protein [Corallococcus exiguus]RKI26592.1 patatin-like phospholipase family protein [Corallococcus sp. AB004]
MSQSLTLLAGPDALRILRERGLRAEDVDILPGASGGPKWLGLEGIDRVLFGELLQQPRTRPLHLIGSSIGSWRLACLAQKDPVAALKRFADAYLEQRYPPKPSPSLVSERSATILDSLLGPDGMEEILTHPWARLHVVTTRCKGLLAMEQSSVQLAGFVLGALANAVSRRTLGLHMERVVFHTAGDTSPFAGLKDLPSVHRPLTRDNLRPALIASGSIPMVLAGVHDIPGAPPGTYRDGGVVDYHLDVDYGTGDGLVLYPHFYPYVVPGWFDKSLKWRRAGPLNFRRALIITPSPAHLARLPGGRIPDRSDFTDMEADDRIRAWRQVLTEGDRMADELRELLASGRIADHVQPL